MDGPPACGAAPARMVMPSSRKGCRPASRAGPASRSHPTATILPLRPHYHTQFTSFLHQEYTQQYPGFAFNSLTAALTLEAHMGRYFDGYHDGQDSFFTPGRFLFGVDGDPVPAGNCSPWEAACMQKQKRAMVRSSRTVHRRPAMAR